MGGGLGALAGRVWSIGVMGYNAQSNRGGQLLGKLEQSAQAEGGRA